MAKANSKREGGARANQVRRVPALVRLLEAERSEEVLPILLEEISGLGFSRVFVLAVDYETGEIIPSASVGCSPAYLDRFRTSLYTVDSPLVGILRSQQPAVLDTPAGKPAKLYCQPAIFSSHNACWEAPSTQRNECLAFANSRGVRELRLEAQVCSACRMRGYASLICVELAHTSPKQAADKRGSGAAGKLGPAVDPRLPAGDKSLKRIGALVPGVANFRLVNNLKQPASSSTHTLTKLRELIEVAGRHMTRLVKAEHYYNRMTGMDLIIAQMQTMMQNMTDPVVLTDTHYRVVLQNREAERYFKPPESEKVISEGLVRAIELNNLLFSATLSSMAVSGSNAHRDLTLVDVTEGEERLFEAVCTPTFARDNMPIGIVTVMRDVTDLRRADQELRRNYELLRQAEDSVRQDRDRLNVIIENVGDPIVVCDSNASIVLLDPLAEQLFGSGSGSGAGSGSGKSAVAGKSGRGEIRDAALVMNQAQLDAYIYAFTYSFDARQTGALRLFSPSLKSDVEYDARSGKIYDDRGQVAYTVTVLRDFTALRKVEQLKLERRMLEVEKFAAAGRLAATIAHEVNNPMEAIKNAIWLLQDSVSPEAQNVYQILKEETERVARIVRQMLGLYRNNEIIRPVNINTVVEDTLLLLNRQIQRANILVEEDLRELPEAMVAADQLRQVLSNLVINAKDAMPHGGTLRVRTRHLGGSSAGSNGGLKNRRSVRILIADNGAGIPKEMQQSIFEPFVTTKGEKGTGLGLWIVRGIINNHGGKISVRSRVGQGTVFKIDLPVVPIVE